MDKRFFQKVSKIALGTISLVAGVYVALSPRVAKRLYASALFHPWLHPEGDWDVTSLRGIDCQNIYYPSLDGTKLHAWYFPVPNAKYTVLISHGNSGNLTIRTHLMELFLDLGISVLIYDYRGYGLSKGNPSLPGIVNDGVASYNYLTETLKIPAQEIILYGESLGAAVACQIAARCAHIGLILQSGFSSLARIGQKVMPFIRYYPSALFPKPDLDSLTVVRNLDTPILIIHGMRDTVVPFSHAEEIFAHAKEPKKFLRLREAAHNDICSVAKDQFSSTISEFIESLAD